MSPHPLPSCPSGPREGRLRRGRKHGVWVERDGATLVEQVYLNGVRHGPYRRWSEGGALLEAGAFRHDAREGLFVSYEADRSIERRYEQGVLEGLYRVVRSDGAVMEAREYREGKVPRDGAWERVHPVQPRWVRERGAYRDGLREGRWTTFYPNGSPIWSAFYVRGREHGSVRRQWQDGGLWSEGECRDGVRVGRWAFRRHDGSPWGEAAYGDDGRVTSLRWWSRDGVERAPVSVRSDEELDGWLALSDAWDAALRGDGTFDLQYAVDRWPEGQWETPLAWIDAQVAAVGLPALWSAGPPWLQAMLDGDDDPRAARVDAIELDHAEFDEDQVAALRRYAPQIAVLSLDECWVAPSLAALFAEHVAWSKLRVLSLCDCEPLDDVVPLLVAAPWAAQLTGLFLGGHDEPLSGAAFDALARAPWLGSVETLALDGVGDLALLTARTTPALQVLELDLRGRDLKEGELLALLDRARRPALKKLQLRGVEAPPELTSARAARPEVALTIERY